MGLGCRSQRRHDTSTTFGGLIALENLLNDSSSPPAIVSISYGECEAENGATANVAYISIHQQAVAEGLSVFVSSGDEGAASCDADLANATHGIGVSGFASTAYNVAVGGTDFGDAFAGTTSTYWSSTNTSTFGSALSYIPEIPWDDSCASTLISTTEGYAMPYGTSGFCNSSIGQADFETTASGSGGPSGCASGRASTTGVVSGTCAGTAKPSWQAGLGVPADGVRDIPDVSLFAANGVWGHYSLAATEYGSSGSSACNSSNGNGVSPSCIFYDTTLGDIDINCSGTHSCYRPSGTLGVLSTSTSSYAPAYKTGTGWDFATGLGSINAYNLVTSWP